ncbi:MAG: hypothetical protein AAGF11_25485 [Myxococcota bacterium]
MPSKSVINRLRSSRIVVEAARVHGPQVAADIQARLPEDDAGAAGVAALCESLAVALESATGRMDQADAAHEAELADDASPRRARDESSDALANALVELRAAVNVLYGSAVVATLGYTGETPREPTTVATLAARVLEQLPPLSEAIPVTPGLAFDPTAMVELITGQLDALRPALQAVAREAREAEQTLLAKQAAITDYDATFRAVATTLEGLFVLAGATELADRVRPSRRRPGRVDQEPEPAEPDAAEAEPDGAPTDA